MIIKDPVGRMRYRAMNSDVGQAMGGFANFQNWYESRGGQPEELSAAFESAYGVTDAFKSFPSGHTCAAGMTYALIMLPDVLGTRNKGLRALCWIFPRPVHRHRRDQPYRRRGSLLLRRAYGRHHRVRVHDVRARGRSSSASATSSASAKTTCPLPQRMRNDALPSRCGGGRIMRG